MLKVILSSVLLFASAVTATAQVAPRFDRLFAAMEIPKTVAIMRLEGLDYGASLQEDLFPDSGGAAWSKDVARIYDQDWMLAQVRSGMAAALESKDIAPITAFFEGELGRKIIELELSARSEMRLQEVEDESQRLYRDLVLEQDPRMDLLVDFVTSNDLVESNVTGAMNSNFAFYKSLAEGGAFGFDLTEAEMIEDVWGQEVEIRNESSDWIYGFLTLAYWPLTNEDIKAYIAFSDSEAGQDMNAALFEAFDAMFVAISSKLGTAAARYMSGSDI